MITTIIHIIAYSTLVILLFCTAATGSKYKKLYEDKHKHYNYLLKQLAEKACERNGRNNTK